jgi:hypothetical protein
MRRARILDWVRMRRSHDRYNDVEPSSPPQSSPDYTIVIRGYNFREGQGGLMSYGIDTVPIFRRAASFVAKILRGAKPSDLPVEQPTSFEFTLNLKTAKAIGVSIPTSILLRADEVIE